MGSCSTRTDRIRGGTSRACIMRVRVMIRGMGILVLRLSRWGRGLGRHRLGCFRTGLSRCSRRHCHCTEDKIHWILLCNSRLDMIHCFQLEKHRLIRLEIDTSLSDLICSNLEIRFRWEIIDLFLQLSTDFLWQIYPHLAMILTIQFYLPPYNDHWVCLEILLWSSLGV